MDFHLLCDLVPALVSPRPLGLAGKCALAPVPQPALHVSVIDRPKSGFFLPMGDCLEQTPLLDRWRRIPQLNRTRCHWSRRMAYALATEWTAV